MAPTAGIAHLESAIVRYSPAAPDFYFELGDGYARAGKSDEAIRWYKEALRRKPEFRPAIKQLAATLIGKGEYARADGGAAAGGRSSSGR